MGKIVDITDKLKFDTNPALIIAGKTYEVNADATTMIRVMGKLGDADKDVTPGVIAELCELIFTKEAKEALDELHLKFDDYTTVVHEAIELISGGDEEEETGEPVIQDTTSSMTGI